METWSSYLQKSTIPPAFRRATPSIRVPKLAPKWSSRPQRREETKHSRNQSRVAGKEAGRIFLSRSHGDLKSDKVLLPRRKNPSRSNCQESDKLVESQSRKRTIRAIKPSLELRSFSNSVTEFSRSQTTTRTKARRRKKKKLLRKFIKPRN